MTTKRRRGTLVLHEGSSIKHTQCPQWRNALHNNTKAVKTLERGENVSSMPHFRSSVQRWKSYITGIGQSGGRRHPHQPMRGVDTPPHRISCLLLLYGTTLFQTLRMSLHSSWLLQHHTKFVKWNIKNKTISYTPSSFYTNQVDKKPTTKTKS